MPANVLTLARFKICEEVEDLELELVFAVEVPASPVRPSDLKKVDGKHAVDELELYLLLQVLLP